MLVRTDRRDRTDAPERVDATSTTRRLVDLVVASSALVALAPVLLGLALVVATTSRGGAFYRSERLGLGGRRFHAYKLRTMRADADTSLDDVLAADDRLAEEYRRFHKLAADPRVTSVGRVLRRHSLDELPQLWNVVRGEMTIVGPRPKLPSEAADWGDSLAIVLSVKPGCTGPWQIGGRSSLAMDERIEIDLQYLATRSLRRDALICLRTVATIVRADRRTAM